MFWLFIIIAGPCLAAYFAIVAMQKSDYKKHGKPGESYSDFCSRYYSNYI